MCSGKVDAILAARRMILVRLFIPISRSADSNSSKLYYQDLLPAQLCLDIENYTLQDPISNVDVRSKHYFVRENNLTIRMEKSELEPEMRLPSEPYRVCLSLLSTV